MVDKACGSHAYGLEIQNQTTLNRLSELSAVELSDTRRDFDVGRLIDTITGL